ncbi:zinc finger protein 692 [Oncorhynchus tshawytscha]|uniref:C2H2-type domain-containing protein n=1 Tax=Oncorhynchus tshawytscha TaxID=74940 RepID=A0A8C8JJ12_ONCTS|nr:zinc finger protein 692 [Oncorhynchus tshawytscha]
MEQMNDPLTMVSESTPDTIRQQRRRELDARRSKSRVRLGSCLQSWGQLKNHLGFSLHSELANYLLQSYFSKVCDKCSDNMKGDTTALVTSRESLHHLVLLVHTHGQQCPFPPTLQSNTAREKQAADTEGSQSKGEAVKQRTGPKHLPPQTGAKDCSSPEDGLSPCALGKEMREPPDVLEAELCLHYVCEGGHLLSWQPSQSDCDEKRGAGEGEEEIVEGDITPAGPTMSKGRIGAKEPKKESVTGRGRLTVRRTRARGGARSVVTQEEAQQPGEERMDLTTLNSGESNSRGSENAQEGSVAGSDTMPAESLQSLEDCFHRRLPMECNDHDDDKEHNPDNITGEKDVPSPDRPEPADNVSQIVSKKKRKTTPKAILPCEFDGCGKIFSSRQYLNHHMKYQHFHQRTFTCSHTPCGKSFNFKKHLKEHEKLHSNQRDFICEFCARAFRTNSHLLIHRRIHTGEKPIQCEVCGFTCRQKASLNWHMKKHDAESSYQFPCEVCGRRFEKSYNLTAHHRKSHPD